MRSVGRHLALAARDRGQEAVGQALLITVASAGALSVGQLSRIAADACQVLMAALG
jgi:hypothetical protein